MSLTQVVTHATGDVFPATDWNTYVRDNVNYLIVAGANLASAATITPTNEFHIVTGTNAIANLTPATPVAGQQVKLLFQSALTVQNNGGGTGNIRTKSGADRQVAANEITTFVYDGTVWRESGAPSPKFTVSALSGGPPASPADGDIWVATGVDGSGTRWHFQYDVAESTANKWKFLGGGILQVLGTGTSAASITPARSGLYRVIWGVFGTVASGGDANIHFKVAGSDVRTISFGNFAAGGGVEEVGVTGGTTSIAAQFTGTTGPNGISSVGVYPVRMQ